MVRWRVIQALALAALVSACGSEKDMPDTMDMADTMTAARAMQSTASLDSMLDTLPGGEMARGDSAASMDLLHQKMR